MGNTYLVIIIAIISVGFLVFALSITLLRKGRNIQSEVGENEEMKKRGLSCATDEFRREESALRGEEYDTLNSCGTGNCGSCTDEESDRNERLN